jgi:hypothetical protein
MKADNPLDKHLDINKQIPLDVRDSTVFVNDTLNIAWLSAQSIFEDKATPEIALQIYDRIKSHMEQKKNS